MSFHVGGQVKTDVGDASPEARSGLWVRTMDLRTSYEPRVANLTQLGKISPVSGRLANFKYGLQ